tara:strand:+ start:150 stop:785 length:636 start_codon:yes stop_codon:yes gene_type:complete
MQRLFDILLSLLAIFLLSPVLIICIAILKNTGEGEIFYLQKRVGLNKKIFNLMKFATMVKNSENLGAGTITVKNDPRVLPFGKFLRKTKINELPQLFNILKGEMSVIGPRPLHTKQFGFYSESDQLTISSVCPGLSGYGSIYFRDEESILSNSNDPDEVYKKKITPLKARLEKKYIREKSIYLYFKLIFLTLIVVIFPSFKVKDIIAQDER